MTYREYQRRDENSLIQLIKDLRDDRATYDAVDYHLIDPFFYVDHYLYNPEYTIFVAELIGNIWGFILLRVYSESVEIKMLAVHPSQRGKKHGKILKEIATELGAKLRKEKIYTINRFDNERSYKLNISLGWKIIPVSEHYYRAEYVYNPSGRLYLEQNREITNE